ncbi:MAG: ADP-forming succinate--CoA ligase subunit beta [Candidatus Cloacimonadota bacterium]|nr:MAG: ADP-forming succinate--CoA ligase subunit beta [Candidatus Cloacimonadota bacterium]
MKIHEYQAKLIFKDNGIPIPDGQIAFSVEQGLNIAKQIGFPVVIKSQVQVGGRGKAGGIKLSRNEQEFQKSAAQILSMTIKALPVEKILIEQALNIKKEYYISIVMDRQKSKPVVIASKEGGIDIEEIAKRTPEKIYKLYIEPEIGLLPYQARMIAFNLFYDASIAFKVADIINKLYKIFEEKDASLVEINPLILTQEGNIFAIDAKINFDDNALDRQPEIVKLREVTENEKKELDAKAKGLSYIQLTGNIGCMVNGAGLAMATMDVIKKYGGEPANFLDIGGSSNPQKVIDAFNILNSDKNVKAIFINIFGGITRCDDVANGIIMALGKLNIGLPIITRLIGTNEQKAKEILAKSNFNLISVSSLSSGAKKAVELVT